MTRCLIVLLLGVALSAQASPQAIQAMAATERAFAAATAEIGVRDGFLTFFADDAISLVSGTSGATASITRAKDALRARPAPSLPLASTLLWAPFTGQVAQDGSFGWLTGGSVSVNAVTHEPAYTGAYFSIWRRQADGTWKVWLDQGITLPRMWNDAAPFRAAPDPDAGEPGGASETIAEAEQTVAAGGDRWRARLAATARLHRDGVMPLADRDTAAEWATREWRAMRYTLVTSGAAGSDDLGFALGGYDGTRLDGTLQHGIWVRVWKRAATGRWRIVFETSAPSR